MTVAVTAGSSLIVLSVEIEIKEFEQTSLYDCMSESSNHVIQIVPFKSSLDFKTK